MTILPVRRIQATDLKEKTITAVRLTTVKVVTDPIVRVLTARVANAHSVLTAVIARIARALTLMLKVVNVHNVLMVTARLTIARVVIVRNARMVIVRPIIVKAAIVRNVLLMETTVVVTVLIVLAIIAVMVVIVHSVLLMEALLMVTVPNARVSIVVTDSVLITTTVLIVLASYGGSSYGGSSYGDRPQRPRFNPDGGRGGYGRPQQRRTPDYDPNAKYSRKKQIEYKEQFTDPNEPIRLNKFLANAGVCSRREADEFITAGVVSVNGVVVTELGTKIKRADEVKFHDQMVSIERKIYILLNKPKDTVTTSDDPQARRTVMDLVKGACDERIYPVGRLDRNTTGVLLLTNDGDLASKLTHPKFLKK